MSHISQLHYANPPPQATVRLREQLEDFQVWEQLSFEPEGSGQHVYLYLEKRNLNTDQVAESLARFAGVKPVAIGYAGLKDRRAITRQWFSVDLAGKPEPAWQEFNSDLVRVTEVQRHTRKLKRGSIQYNSFQIALRDYSAEVTELEHRLVSIQRHGVPNYFGEQRFGRDESNLVQFEKLMKGELRRIKRHQRSLYISAARSMLFNLILSQRVADKNWNCILPGEVLMLDGSHSVFPVESIDDDLVNRNAAFDVHPTAPLWGSGELMSTDKARELETQTLQPYTNWRDFLQKVGLEQQRRALRVKVSDLTWHWQGKDVLLSFNLPAGSYATAVLRELVVSR